MATLVQAKANTGLLTYKYKTNSEIVFAAAHITHYLILPNDELMIHNASGSTKLKFLDKSDRDVGIALLDDTMNLTLTEAFVAAAI